jgi:hypothetical protein
MSESLQGIRMLRHFSEMPGFVVKDIRALLLEEMCTKQRSGEAKTRRTFTFLPVDLESAYSYSYHQ